MVITEMKVFKTIVDTAEALFIKATRDIMDITVIRTIMITTNITDMTIVKAIINIRVITTFKDNKEISIIHKGHTTDISAI
jgi:hypothetical protein